MKSQHMTPDPRLITAHSIGFLGIFLFILATTFAIHYPGLSGTFLFDDFTNLNRMGTHNPTSSLQSLLLYLQDVSRPLSFASFLLNDISWPTTPYGFIYTNLLIHILNGILLIWLAYRTLISIGTERKSAEWVALIAGGLWLTHPLFVSTTLYVVQRMTLLSALFILCSLLCYLHGRSLLSSRPKTGYLWLVLGVGGFALLSVAAKEIAVHIPLYLLLYETILFQGTRPHEKYPVWKAVFIYIPIPLIIAVLATSSVWRLYEARNFDWLERLMTQPRTLWEYIYHLLIPKTRTNGLHYENFEISRSLADPITTIPSLLAIIAILFLAIRIRKKTPLLSFSILFFFSGHLLESTVVPLEIYFEHRNYLPSIFLFLSLAYYAFVYLEKQRLLRVIIPVTLFAIFSTFTYARATLWGNPLLLMTSWTESNPKSVRNYLEGAIQAHQYSRHDIARSFLEKGQKHLPDDIYINIQLLDTRCHSRDEAVELVAHIKKILAVTEELQRQYVYKNLKTLVRRFLNGHCPAVSEAMIESLIESALDNPNLKHAIRQQELFHTLGMLALGSSKPKLAIERFDKAFAVLPESGLVFQQTAMLASNGYYEQAKQHLNLLEGMLDKAHKNPEWNLKNRQLIEQYEDLSNRLDNALKKDRSQQSFDTLPPGKS